MAFTVTAGKVEDGWWAPVGSWRIVIPLRAADYPALAKVWEYDEE